MDLNSDMVTSHLNQSCRQLAQLLFLSFQVIKAQQDIVEVESPDFRIRIGSEYETPPCCEMPGKLFNFSKSLFSYPWNWKNKTDLTRRIWGLNKIVLVKHLAQCLANITSTSQIVTSNYMALGNKNTKLFFKGGQYLWSFSDRHMNSNNYGVSLHLIINRILSYILCYFMFQSFSHMQMVQFINM